MKGAHRIPGLSLSEFLFSFFLRPVGSGSREVRRQERREGRASPNKKAQKAKDIGQELQKGEEWVVGTY